MGRAPARIARACCLVAVASTFALGITAPAAAPALEFETVPARVAPEHWIARPSPRSEPPTEGHALNLMVVGGYCHGEPKPEIDHVQVVERPRTAARRFKSAVVTVFLRYPERQRVIPPPDSDVVYNACAGLGLGLPKRIKLKRPAADLFIYDGSYTPPHRQWPLLRR